METQCNVFSKISKSSFAEGERNSAQATLKAQTLDSVVLPVLVANEQCKEKPFIILIFGEKFAIYNSIFIFYWLT